MSKIAKPGRYSGNLVAEALDALEKEGFAKGEAWNNAHDLAQAHEGEAIFDRLHALLHRIEGDEFNAGYWYRRARVPAFSGSFAAEKRDIETALS